MVHLTTNLQRTPDLVFTVMKSKLSTMCDQKKITHLDFEDFDQVIRGIEQMDR